MVAYRRSDRPNEGYRVAPSLPEPWGRVGPWQTGFTRKAQAEQVETWLHDMARTRPEIIDALVAKKFSLETAWIAKLRGTLDELLAGLNDPFIVDAIGKRASETPDGKATGYRAECTEPRTISGLDQLIQYAEPGMRLSALRGKAITQLYRRAMDDGRKPNSVKRSLHRSVAGLLRFHLGEKKMLEAFTDVIVPSEDDTREVHIDREEMSALLAAFAPEFFDMPVLAMLLAIDRGPLQRITPRYFEEDRGLLHVLDTKTAHRPRTIELSTPALSILRRRCARYGKDEPIFPLTDGQVRNFWETARDKAAGIPTRNSGHRGWTYQDERRVAARANAKKLLEEQRIVTLPMLRFKDLRHLLPTAWNALGLPAEDLKPIMGWAKNSNMSERYTTARIEGDRKSLDAVAEYLGLDRIHLRASGE